jgi:ubiquinone/menaquinone biosynthesis C-methylase UbiE
MTAAERDYYHQRAPEYDDFYSGGGLFAARARPGWKEELDTLQLVVSSVPAGSILDVACGTGFLTRRFPGSVIAIDQSSAMLQIARTRLPNGHVVQADALNLPFGALAFDCVSAGHFYGHLREPERARFLAEARRVARQILIIDAALHEGLAPEQEQARSLSDGSRHSVYKRYFTPAQLVAELGGGAVLHAERWFVAVLA